MFTKLQFLSQVSKQCQKISAFFQAKSLDDPRYSQWLRKETMKWHPATAKAVMLTFDIDAFIFRYLDTVQLCWKLWVL